MILILVQKKITCSHFPQMFKPKTHSTHSQILETSYKASYRGIQSLFDFICMLRWFLILCRKKSMYPLPTVKGPIKKILAHLKCHIKQAKGVFKACLILFVGSELKNCKIAAEKPHLPLPHMLAETKCTKYTSIYLPCHTNKVTGVFKVFPILFVGPKLQKGEKKAKKKHTCPPEPTSHFPLPIYTHY